MRSKIICAFLVGFAFNGLAQSGKTALADDLLKDKVSRVEGYVPILNGKYMYALYMIPPEEMIGKLEKFQSTYQVQLDGEKDTLLRNLQKKDLEYFCRNILSWYSSLYGMDSVGTKNLEKVIMEKKGAPDYIQLLDSAQRKMFVKRLTPEEKNRIDDIVKLNTDANDEALFKRSASYRKWVDNYITKLRQFKYATDTTLGYFEGTNIVKLKVVNSEITNPFIKEYLNYQFTNMILKTVKNVPAKEEAYKNFMAIATNTAYKTEVQEVYDNYKNISGNSLAPDFTYVSADNKKISLKDLRGKYVYIDVWATWCAPCKAEIPFLAKMEEDYQGKNINFVSLSVDKMADKKKWATYVKKNHLQGIQVMADNDFNSDFVKKFNITTIPRFILIGPDGKIVSPDAKRPSDPELRSQFDRLLK